MFYGLHNLINMPRGKTLPVNLKNLIINKYKLRLKQAASLSLRLLNLNRSCISKGDESSKSGRHRKTTRNDDRWLVAKSEIH